MEVTDFKNTYCKAVLLHLEQLQKIDPNLMWQDAADYFYSINGKYFYYGTGDPKDFLEIYFSETRNCWLYETPAILPQQEKPMKNKKPLQFVKELPPHTELWKIVDETIIRPAEGLSVEQLKHYMYSYLCVCSDFKTDKLMLQTDMATEHILTVKDHIRRHRDILYPELLPEIPGLPRTLLTFLYDHIILLNAIPTEYHEVFTRIAEILGNPLPSLSTLSHSEDVVEVHSKRDLELSIYTALIDNTPIPAFKLVVESTSDGWIEWNGGECPVDGDTILEVKFRDGVIHENEKALYLGWKHLGRESDIVAYRIPEEAE